MQKYTFQTLLEKSISLIIVMNIVYIRRYSSGVYGSVLYNLLLHINAGLWFLLLFNKLSEIFIECGTSLIPVCIVHSFSFLFLVNQNHEIYAILWSLLYSKTKNTEVREFTGQYPQDNKIWKDRKEKKVRGEYKLRIISYLSWLPDWWCNVVNHLTCLLPCFCHHPIPYPLELWDKLNNPSLVSLVSILPKHQEGN